MTLAKFILATEREQERFLANSVYLLKREHGKYLCMLFQLEDFYVEKVFNEHRELVELNAFNTICLLEPYLELIDIQVEF